MLIAETFYSGRNLHIELIEDEISATVLIICPMIILWDLKTEVVDQSHKIRMQ